MSSLERILSLLGQIKSQIRYSATPLPALFSWLASQRENAPLVFLKECADRCAQGQFFPQALRESVVAAKYALCLTDDDQQLLLRFGDTLGTTDIEGQLAAIDLYQNLMEGRLHEAGDRKKTLGKLYQRLGLLSGIGLAIVIL